MKDFSGRVAAITGASSGIGRALALALAARKADLALSSRSNHEALSETAELCRDLGVKVTTFKVDVGNRDQVHNWAEEVMKNHGRVNLLINNAGVAHAGSLGDVDYDDFEWVMNTNFWGVVHGTKAFLPHLQHSGEGHIVNIASIFGLFAPPGLGTYAASKFAVRGFTEALRQELDLKNNGVSATCVLPGGVRTNIASKGRVSESIRELTRNDPEEDRRDFETFLRTSPEDAARAVLRGVQKNARRVLIGVDALAADSMQRLMPGLYQRIVTTGIRLVRH